MICNAQTLLERAPIKGMLRMKHRAHGVSHGLGEAGYDIRIKQRIVFSTDFIKYGRFVIASAIEEFDMPNNLVGIVHDKSSWARRGLSVFNTVIEPGWKGFLTLELVYHGNSELIIPAGAGIAQVVFHHTTDAAEYSGRYQNQADEPVAAIELR